MQLSIIVPDVEEGQKRTHIWIEGDFGKGKVSIPAKIIAEGKNLQNTETTLEVDDEHFKLIQMKKPFSIAEG